MEQRLSTIPNEKAVVFCVDQKVWVVYKMVSSIPYYLPILRRSPRFFCCHVQKSPSERESASVCE